MNTLELATDFMVQSGQCNISHFDDRAVQTTPNEPNFWYGNRVIFRSPPRDPEALIAQFHKDVPQAKHVCIGWDIPNLSRDMVEALFEGSELSVEQADTLALRGALKRTEAPDGIDIRPFHALSDWAQSEAIGRLDLLDDGAPEQGLDHFLSKRSDGRREQIAQGKGAWFGAFSGDVLVGDMGIFHDQTYIRYQSVQTHRGHRRRGICSALLCTALDWAQSRAVNALPVIVANADTQAGRLYRRAGFELAETTLSAYRPPL
ncbi:GNAT family N-acetyltransferase [Aliiroseovarius marinus]|uniref:GNAT family N-acetyltransferase n=1 Tax=Aliiroseovarius marinus TaxID=2500159 RepID=UPI003D7D0C78